ncbi:MAG: efflux RND transporter periplasmic adaptor subunit [Kiritimatiellae bacterium]|nr:efflux RND transporter periplasmic adaptor subunit [Kiritimatiellia bacterium]
MMKIKTTFEMFAVFSFSVVSLAAEVSVPVGEVEEVCRDGARTYPARIVSISEVAVRPQVTGEILEVGFKNGQKVNKGDVLYRIDPVKYVAAEKNALAKVAQIDSNLEYAQKLELRYRELVKTRAVPQDDYDRVKSELKACQASKAAAEADLQAAQDDLMHCTIVAPISGRIGTTAFTDGNFVSRGGEELVRLVQTDPVRAVFEISSVEYDEAFNSNPERIVEFGIVTLSRMTGADVIATGRVEYVENIANTSTDSVKIYACIPNELGTLLAGQTVMARLTSTEGVRSAAVPPNAVALDAKGTYVWVLNSSNIVECRRVVRGPLQSGKQIIRHGLKRGEKIVLDGVHRVKIGDSVRVGR